MGHRIKITIFIYLLVATCAQYGESQVLFSGACPELAVVEDFDVSSYMGLWYEFEKYPVVTEMGGKCITTSYSVTSNGTIAAVNSQYNIYLVNNVHVDGTISVVDGGKLLYRFDGQPADTGTPYWILDTDYSSYSVVYSCVPVDSETNSVSLWILTREIVPSAETIAKAIGVVTANNLPINQLTVTDNIGCYLI